MEDMQLDVFVQGIVNGSQGITFLVTHPRANCGWCWSRTSLDGMPMNAIATRILSLRRINSGFFRAGRAASSLPTQHGLHMTSPVLAVSIPSTMADISPSKKIHIITLYSHAKKKHIYLTVC
jgi:hypothetical protein